MMETDDIEKLATYIRDTGYCRIGVDGTNGAGKSTMASKLSKILGVEYLKLDNYLVKKQGRFLDYLKYDEIKEKMSGLECFVVDGVCLLSAVEKIDAHVDCLVYVKRTHHGLWADERECEVAGDIEEHLRKERETVRLIRGLETAPESLGLAEEIIRYHARYKPHHKADFFYMREDC